MEKYFEAGQTTYKIMAHARCMMDNQGYKYTRRLLILIAFHRNNGCKNALQCYIMRTLAILFNVNLLAPEFF
jgi:hypothetical protein